MILADLELDLDVFQGPFDLLLALVLREEVELADVPIAEIVVAYVERAYEKGELDLESASEFLVLMAALLEIKVRLLFPGEVEEDDLSPEQAEAELFQRLIEYRRFQGAAGAGGGRVQRGPLAAGGGRRPAAGAAPAYRRVVRAAAAGAGGALPRPLPHDPAHAPRLPVRGGGEGARSPVAGGGVPGAAGDDQARRGRSRAAPAVRADQGGGGRRGRCRGRRRRRPGDRVSELTHTVEALLFVASEPLTPKELAELTDAAPERIERALGALADRHCEGRSGVVLERAAGGYGLRAARETAEVCARLVNRPSAKGLSQAALETLAIVAYLQPVSRPEIARIRGVGADSAVGGLIERGLIEEAGRADTPGTPVVYRTTRAFLRVFGLGEGDDLPALSDFELTEADHQALRARLHLVADQRAGQA